MKLRPEVVFGGWFTGLIVGASLSTVWPASNAIIIILLCGFAGLIGGIVIELVR